MNIFKICIISATVFFLAMLCFAFYNQIIIIRIPSYNNITYSEASSFCKKEVLIYFFHHEKWNHEKQELLWSNNNANNSYQLINAWLTLLEEEQILSKKITVQTALLSRDNTLYVSFDHNPFCKDYSIFAKWMLIESLLKTIRKNNISIQHIQLLVQHQPLTDYHLDFSMPWPIEGFL